MVDCVGQAEFHSPRRRALAHFSREWGVVTKTPERERSRGTCINRRVLSYLYEQAGFVM